MTIGDATIKRWLIEGLHKYQVTESIAAFLASAHVPATGLPTQNLLRLLALHGCQPVSIVQLPCAEITRVDISDDIAAHWRTACRLDFAQLGWQVCRVIARQDLKLPEPWQFHVARWAKNWIGPKTVWEVVVSKPFNQFSFVGYKVQTHPLKKLLNQLTQQVLSDESIRPNLPDISGQIYSGGLLEPQVAQAFIQAAINVSRHKMSHSAEKTSFILLVRHCLWRIDFEEAHQIVSAVKGLDTFASSCETPLAVPDPLIWINKYYPQ